MSECALGQLGAGAGATPSRASSATFALGEAEWRVVSGIGDVRGQFSHAQRRMYTSADHVQVYVGLERKNSDGLVHSGKYAAIHIIATLTYMLDKVNLIDNLTFSNWS